MTYIATAILFFSGAVFVVLLTSWGAKRWTRALNEYDAYRASFKDDEECV